jgi:collagenase-like PrtC family protease
MTFWLSLGPVFFNWSGEALRDFYFQIADEAPVDTVYVGEVVCFKRAPFFAKYAPEAIERLQRAGKEVVLSSLALVADDREAAAMGELAEHASSLVEANDLGMARALAGRPHVIGPFINVYNEDTLRYLAERGAVRACLPPELPSASLEAIARRSSIPLEIQVFGRVPLAISARCFHARAHGLHKDGCQFVCGNDPDGLDIRTLDDEAFLTVNGTQTLSHTCLNLMGELSALKAAGIARFRLSPQKTDMVAIARAFRDVLDGRMGEAEASAAIADHVRDMPFSNGFVNGTEGFRYVKEHHSSVE